MRTFYIFKIKKHFAILTKNNPYTLYKTIEDIYKLKENELEKNKNLFNHIKDTFNKDVLNTNIYNSYKNKYTYTRFKDIHTINNYYTKERSRLTVNKTYLLLRSTEEVPSFLKTLSASKQNMFVCDFENKDYFWIEDLVY